ncbi:RtcB family protein [Microbulbifer celer]|nr:RtcB family protein [Microbulbifer celer]
MPVKMVLNSNAPPNTVPVKIYTEDVEAAALQQLKNIAQLPIVHSHVAAMPDVHMGIGATVGSVIPTLGAIIPAAVGVDIGCGMNAVRTSLQAHQLPDNLKPLRDAIERRVPVGFGRHKRISAREAAAKQLAGGRITYLPSTRNC